MKKNIIFAIANQKGGCGKTTTATALAAGLHRSGKRILLIDLDPQGNATFAMKEKTSADRSSLQVLTKTAAAADCIRHTDQGDIIPADKGLAAVDMILNTTGKEYRLKEQIEPIRGDYDVIVIDCPPSLGIITVNALTAADRLIVPIEAAVFSLQGILDLKQTVETIQRYTNPALVIDGILLTRYTPRSILSRDMASTAEKLAEAVRTRVYDAKIRDAVAIRESQAERKSIFEYMPRSKVAEDYRKLIFEITGETVK